MLTAKENYLALVSGGSPDRFVNQYEAFGLLFSDPLRKMDKRIKGQDTLDPWGVTIRWPITEHAGTPYVTDATKVCPDITEWKDYVKAPDLDLPDEMWSQAIADASEIKEAGEQLVTGYCTTGLFERLHFLMGFEDALCNLMMEPEASHELLDYLTDWRMKYFEILTSKLPLEAVFFHDDWGSKTSTFMNPEIWREFFKPRYKKLYDFLNSKGIHVIHHSDSYCATLVDDMVDVGIETWQGVLPSNDLPVLQKQLGGKLTLMGGFDSGVIDRDDTTPEEIHQHVEEVFKACAPGGFWVPSVTNGGPECLHMNNFHMITEEINKQNATYFGK